VHQGNRDGIKGRYLINAVDEVAQFQVVCAVARNKEVFLLPVMEAMMVAFPFVMRGLHLDNGSEYIRWPHCWRSSGSNKLSHAPDRPTTTHWRRA
jgi:hypothetical protein